MANLPSNTFMFNYNAKEYNPATYTFPKTTGQLFDYDLALNGAPSSYTDEYVDLSYTSNIYMGKVYNSTSDNPFNRGSGNYNFTFIYKTSGFTSADTNLFSNRDSSRYNFMVRGRMFHTSSSGYLLLEPNSSPQICVIRLNSDASGERKFVDENGNTLQIVTAGTGTALFYYNTRAVGFFSGYGNQSAENFQNRFYWMYCSLETLTDEQVLQVIQYNEKLKNFEIEPDTLFFSSNGGTQSVAINSDNPWTATTTDNWITISPTTGNSGEGTISITVGSSIFSNRTGTVTITDGEDNLTLTVNQTGYTTLPYNKLYMNGDNLN